MLTKTVRAFAKFPIKLNGKNAFIRANHSVANPNILDLRVGLIKEIRKHENADSLYVSQIQIGTAETDILQVCSGLVKHIPMEELQARRVVIVNNLKTSKMRGIKSEAMVLCGETKTGTVEPVNPPESATIGSILEFDNCEAIPLAEKKRLKSKAFANVSELLSVDNNWNVVYDNKNLLCYKDGEKNNKPCRVGHMNSEFVGARVL